MYGVYASIRTSHDDNNNNNCCIVTVRCDPGLGCVSVPGTHVDIRHKLAVWESFALIPAATYRHDNSDVRHGQGNKK